LYILRTIIQGWLCFYYFLTSDNASFATPRRLFTSVYLVHLPSVTTSIFGLILSPVTVTVSCARYVVDRSPYRNDVDGFYSSVANPNCRPPRRLLISSPRPCTNYGWHSGRLPRSPRRFLRATRALTTSVV